MAIKKGDRIRVLTGKDRGREGLVVRTIPQEQKLVVEGINLHFRFARPKRAGEKGQRLEVPSALSLSKVMLVCPHCGKPTRVGHELSGEKNFRKCKKCAKLIN